MEFFAYGLTLIGAYLLGSIPTGFLVAKARGVDITKVGSGNIGATNAFRVLGKGPGTFVLVVDALKGYLAVFLAEKFGPQIAGTSADTAVLFAITGGAGAILGHNYTCWLRFKGGKGIATSAGVLLGLMPKTLAVATGGWIIFFALTRYVSVASIVAAITVMVATWFFYQSTALRIVGIFMGALAIYKHKVNLRRLLNGTENRIGSKQPATVREAKP